MSGHSKWATIKRKKAGVDAARGKLFTRIIREIVISARMGGGDLAANPRLRTAVAAAKAAQMPNDKISRGIKRGTGEIEGATYDEVLYEGTGPGGTLFIVEGTTDNRNRTVAEIRKSFERHNGALATSGTAAWAFDHLATVSLEKDAATEDQLMEAALNAGAEDYRDEGDEWVVYAPISELYAITQALEEASLKVKESKLSYVPKTKKSVTGRDAEVCLNLSDVLDEHDDVSNVFTDFEIPDEEMERIAALP